MLHLLRARRKTWCHVCDVPVKDTYPEVNCEHTPGKAHTEAHSFQGLRSQGETSRLEEAK